MEGGKSLTAGANIQKISLEDPSLLRQKYKRSTNNSHKKFICVARRLFFRLCTHRERELFEIEYQAHQNSRVYYFIILSHVKLRMRNEERENFKKNFTSLLEAKVASYSQEIQTTSHKNFINFRFEEIADIQFALRALGLYLQDRVEEAIEVIYKKEKGFVLKRQQYQMALNTIKDLEKRLRQYPLGQLLPYINDKTKKCSVKEKKSKQVDDQEWMQSKEGKDKIKFLIKKEKPKQAITYNEEFNNYPLIFLQNSFPIYNSFYQVLFNYNSQLPAFYPHYVNLQNQFSSSLMIQQPHCYKYKQDIKKQSNKTFLDPKKKPIQTTIQTISRPYELINHNDYH